MKEKGVEESGGAKGSSEMLKNYKELKVWKKSYELCLELYRVTKGSMIYPVIQNG